MIQENQSTRLEDKLSEISGDVKVIKSKLDDLVDHEKRIRLLEADNLKQKGFARAVQIAIGFIGVMIGASLKIFL